MAPDPEPADASELQLRWLDDNRLELTPGVVLNVHNQTVFGGELVWDPEDADEDQRPPATAAWAPGGTRAWMTGADLLCVAHPADPRCPEEIQAMTVCARVMPRPRPPPPVPRTDALTSALRDWPTVALDHRGLRPDDRGCSLWRVTIPDGKAPILTRRDREGDDQVETAHEILDTGTRYEWSWIKAINASYFDVYRPTVDEARASCPAVLDESEYASIHSILCYAPLGTWVGETDDAIRLSGLVIYKSLEACQRAVGLKLAGGVPSCGSKTARLGLPRR